MTGTTHLPPPPAIHIAPPKPAHPHTENAPENAVAKLSDLPTIHPNEDSVILQKHTLSKDGAKIVEALEEVKSSVTELKQKVDFDGVGTDLWKDIQKIQKKDLSAPVSNVSTNKLEKQAKSAASELASIAKLVLTSAEFRNIVGDLVNVSVDTLNSWAGVVEKKTQNAVDMTNEKADQALDKANEKKGDVQEGVKEVGKKVSQKAKEGVEEGRDAASSKVDQAADTAKETINDASDKVEGAREKVESATKDGEVNEQFTSAIETAEQQKEAIYSQSKEKAHDARENFNESANDFRDEAHRVLQSGDIVDHRSGGFVNRGNVHKPNLPNMPSMDSGSSSAASGLKDKYENAKDSTASAAQSAQDQISSAVRPSLEQGKEAASKVKDQVNNAAEPYLEEASKMAQKARDTAEEKIVDLKDKVTNMELSDDQIEKIRTSLKNVIMDIQAHPEYEASVDHLISITGKVRKTLKPLTEGTVDIAGDADVVSLEKNLQTVIERLADGRSLDPLLSTSREAVAMAEDDDELINYIANVTQFLRKSIREPKFVQETEYTTEFDRIYYRGKELVEQKTEYKDIAQSLGEEIQHFASALKSNSEINSIGDSIQNLVKDGFLDSKGRPVLKPELLDDLRIVLPSIIKENLANVPLPPLVHSDEDYNFELTNLTLLGDSLVPRYITVDTRTTMDTTIANGSEGMEMFVRVQLAQMYVSAKDVNFSYKKKSGLMHMSDNGLLSFNTPDSSKGITVDLLLSPDFSPVRKSFKVAECEVSIDSLDLKLDDVKHNVLYAVLKPIINKVAKKKVEEGIADMIMKWVIDSDGKIQQVIA